MSRVATCSRGHRWETDGEPPADAGELDALCPECRDSLLTPPPYRPTPNSPGFPTPVAGPRGTDVPAIPGYEPVRPLGRGGMGVVFLARQVALDRRVAVKTLLPGWGPPPDLLARFRREAEAAARLEHPNIVRVYEVGEADGRTYLVMEWVDGPSLARRLAQAPLPAAAAAELVGTLARAMAYAHGQGIVHRDLKPANVLLDADGSPKVTDFGLAKRLDRDDGQTRSGTVLGTPGYIAPELVDGKSREAGPAADVYALGAILYEALTGRPPFRAATALETLDQVRTADPIPPARFCPRLPRDLQTVCLKCLEKSPHRRYRSADELAADLDRFARGLPVLARPVGVVEGGVRWARRRPTAAALLAVCGLSVAGGVAGLLTHNSRLLAEVDRTRRQETETARQKAAALDHVRRGHEALDDLFAILDNPPVGMTGNAGFRAMYHQQARAIVRFYQEVLAGADDADPEVRFCRGMVFVYAGRMRSRLDDRDGAEADFRRAHALLAPLAEHPAAPPRHLQEFAQCCYWRGALRVQSGPSAEADRDFQQTLAAVADLEAAGAATDRDRRLAALCHTRLTASEEQRSHRARAERHAREAVRRWDELVAADPDNDVLRGWWAYAFVQLAASSYHARRWDELDAFARRADAERRWYAAHPPERAAGLSGLARLGEVCRIHAHGLAARGQPEAAVARLSDGIATGEGVVRADPAFAEGRVLLAGLYADRAFTRRAAGETAEAFPDWDRAVELATPEMGVGFRIDRAVARIQTGDVTAGVDDLTPLVSDGRLTAFHQTELARAFAIALAGTESDPRLTSEVRGRRADELAGQVYEAVRRAVSGNRFADAAAFDRYVGDPVLAAVGRRPGFASRFDDLRRAVDGGRAE